MKKIFIFSFILFLAASCARSQTPPAVPGQLTTGQNTSTPTTQLHPVSLQWLMEKKFDGRDLTLGNVLDDNAAYTRYYITYKSGELTISGIMNIPKGTPPEGGWPILFLNHGHIDTSIYTNGRGLKREQDYFARNGFAVLHSDYRNHAESDDDLNSENNFRLGYTEDVINAVLAVQNSSLNNINKQKIGMLGHSMGGGITQNVLVVKPDLVKAAVLYAPVSPRLSDNFERWTLGTRKVSEKIMQLYPAPQESVCQTMLSGIKERFAKEQDYYNSVEKWCLGEKDPKFWENISSETFFQKIQAPMLYFHGTNDQSVPFEWSTRSVKTLQNLNKSAELVEYVGEAHEFGPKWTDFMKKTAEFFKKNLS